MAVVDVLNLKNEKVGQVDLPDSVFAVPVKSEVLHQVVRWQLAGRRQGTHMTKTKGLVSGGGKKPFKQKGTGNARQGSSRSPLMPGGGTAFGPQPRDYSYSLPKKVRKVALSMALSWLKQEGKLKVVDSFKCSGKTKELFASLGKIGAKKAVLVDSVVEQSAQRASNNLVSYKYYQSTALNVFDLLKYNGVILSKDAVGELVKRCDMENA